MKNNCGSDLEGAIVEVSVGVYQGEQGVVYAYIPALDQYRISVLEDVIVLQRNEFRTKQDMSASAGVMDGQPTSDV